MKKTIEEVAEEYAMYNYDSSYFDITDHFIAGAKYQSEQSEGENERLKAESDYYKKRCELAEDCLEKSPCDTDITSEQIEAWNRYHAFIKEFGLQTPNPPQK